jgi:hypothetical protein
MLRVSLTAWLLIAAAGGAHAMVLDALVGVVGSRVIMLSDVRLARDLRRPLASPDEEILRVLIDRALMLAEVERFQQPDPPATAVQAAFEALENRIGAADWAGLLRRHGVDAAYVRDYVSDDLRLEAYLRQRFTALAEPSDEEVAAAYAARERGRDPATAPRPAMDALRQELRAARFDTLVEQWVSELRARGDVVVQGIPAGSG